MVKVLMISMTAMVVVTAIVLVERYRLERLRHELDELRVACEARALEAGSALRRASRS